MTDIAHHRNRPVELLEESLQILRSAGASIVLQNWTGSIPFAVTLLWLLRDVGYSWGSSLILRDSMLCAVAFLWLSYWKSRSSRTIFSLISPGSVQATSWFTQAALQAVFQTLKLFVMPLAALSILGWPPASAFFRALSLEPMSVQRPIRGGFQRGLTVLASRYRENTVAYLAVAVLASVIWLNVLITLLMIPGLWKMLTGYETDWSRMQSPTLFGILTVAAVTTWLLIDPWVQAYVLLRVFYQSARTNGRDLLRQIGQLAAIFLICMFALPLGTPAAETATQRALDHCIDRISRSQDYGWLRPQKATTQTGFLADLAKGINDAMTAAGNRIQGWYTALRYWIRNMLRDTTNPVEDKPPPKAQTQELRWALGILAVLICGAIFALFFQTRRARSVDAGTETAGSKAADVLDQSLLPSDVNQEEWLRLAFEYLANNQTRLSARAFYLANLSYLGTQNFLSLSLSKSNRLYERELARLPKSGDVSSAFILSNRLYERAWFGMRELGADQMELLKGAVAQIRQNA